jgi:hypothetical protein
MDHESVGDSILATHALLEAASQLPACVFLRQSPRRFLLRCDQKLLLGLFPPSTKKTTSTTTRPTTKLTRKHLLTTEKPLHLLVAALHTSRRPTQKLRLTTKDLTTGTASISVTP